MCPILVCNVVGVGHRMIEATPRSPYQQKKNMVNLTKKNFYKFYKQKVSFEKLAPQKIISAI